MRVALIYPPTCDPTAPYLSVPTLTAWLRTHGVEVLPIDANLEAWERLLTRDALGELGEHIEKRLQRLDRKPELSHVEQLAYTALWGARGDAAAAPDAIADALAVLRDASGERFHDETAYEAAVAAVDAAQRVVSAAHAPLEVNFVNYRTPFSMLTAEEIARDARPERDPFHGYFVELAGRLRDADVGLVGISVAFPGQLQPAYSLAHTLRAHLPGVHITVGGPAISQLLMRLDGERLERALGPFHSAIIFEGEIALLALVRALEAGEEPTAAGRLIRGTTVEDMSILPPPDFDGLPLDRYLAPELVLPYDPTRGCYWGVCTFCHYGLAEVGTARYRERPTETIMAHLEAMQARHGVRIFYFSQDVFSPKIATRIAREIRGRGLDIRWGTDMRPERSLTEERCRELADGGQLSAALGVESAAPRVLKLIDKGMPAETVAAAVRNLSAAGIAVEAMCFTDFPTESMREAMQTVRFVDGLADDISLFILGRFDLTHGSLVAQKPGEFGIAEVWGVAGDELGTGLFWAERQKAKSAADQARLDDAVDRLSRRWRLHRYPWAGALSTAHTLLWYAHHGKDVFRHLGRVSHPTSVPGATPRTLPARFDLAAIAADSAAAESEIWEQMVQTERAVSPARYRDLATKLPPARPSPGRWRIAAGEEPTRAGATARTRRGRPGRRPSNATNSTKP